MLRPSITIIYAILLGLVGAAVVHLAVLLLVPVYSERDAWSRLAARAPAFAITSISGSGENRFFAKGADPLFTAFACRFELGEGIAHVRADGELPFWSVSVFDRRGQNIYSFNDRTATDRKLDLVVGTPAQMVELRKDLPEKFASSVFVETEARVGIVVSRIFVPDDSWSELVDQFVISASCRQE